MLAAPEVGSLLTGAIGGSGPWRCDDGFCPVDESNDKEEADETALGPADAGVCRAVAAWLNYMGLDRPDMQYAIKESAGCIRAIGRRFLKKIGQYLLYKPRVVMKYPWQRRPKCIDDYTDSDWGGCTMSRKSTSGAVIMLGST